MRSSASVSRASAYRWRPVFVTFVMGAVACATYEAPTHLGYGGDDGGKPSKPVGGTDSGGESAGGTTGGAPSSSGGGGSGTSTGGTPEPQAGTTATGGAGTSSVGGTGGAPPTDGGEGGEPSPGVDACPTDPNKTAPGVCGCGLPDADTATLAGCASLKAALVHRYDFEGTGTVVTDRVGTAHGAIVGGVSLSKVDGKGAVALTGGTTGPYVNLPNKLISSLTNATLEAWVTWGGGDAWQRLFDFGDSTSATPEDTPANGKTYLFLTPQTDTTAGGTMRAVYSLSGGSAAQETRLDGSAALPQVLTHVALVVDAAGDELVLYVDGVSSGTQAFTGSLASINDVNTWLGRSQYNADPELTGTIHEFRIYSAALSEKQIATSFAGGPDPAFLAE